MTQNFTAPCFIRKNTPELRKKLEELGYEPTRVIFDNERLCIATAVNGEYAKYTNITNEMFDSTNPHETWNCSGRIDCGTNEDLFLALAALREDSDYMQSFTNGEEFILCEKKSWLDGKIPDLIHKRDLSIAVVSMLYNYHKATVEELIEHFKD